MTVIGHRVQGRRAGAFERTPQAQGSRVAKTRLTLNDWVMGMLVAVMGTCNLWKVDSIRAALKIDLTLLSFGLAAVASLAAVLSRPSRFTRALPFAVFLLATLPGTALASLGQPYSVTKTLNLYTLVPAAVLCSCVLINSPERRKTLAVSLLIIGVAVSVGIEVRGVASSVNAARIGLEDANVIGLSRACSLGAVAALGLFIMRARWVLVAAAGLCLHAAVLTGSRGPLLAGALGLAAGILLLMRRGRRRQSLMLVTGALAGAVMTWTVAGSSRLFEATGGVTDQSRAALAKYSLNLAAACPWGIGWGDLTTALPLGLRDDNQGWSQYPHNLLIELLVEGGVVALSGLVFVLWTCWHRVRASRSTDAAVVLALLVAAFGSALTSSDIIGNRTTWMMIGVVLALCPVASTSPQGRTNGQARAPITRQADATAARGRARR